MPFFQSTRANVVVSAFLIQATVIGLMFGYGVFFTVLEDELGWSRTLLSAASSLAVLVMGVFAIVAGQLSDRIGPRWVLTFTGVTTGLGYVLMSAMNAPWQLLFCFGLLVGLGFATHDVVTLSTVSSWYPRRRGFITGIIKTGSACGQVAVPLIVTWLIAVSSWRAALMTVGILSSLALIGLAQGMKRRPSEPALDQKKMLAAPNEARDGLSFEKARSTRTLWILCAIQFCFLPSMMTIPLHIVAHATDLGMTTTKAASVLSTLGRSQYRWSSIDRSLVRSPWSPSHARRLSNTVGNRFVVVEVCRRCRVAFPGGIALWCGPWWTVYCRFARGCRVLWDEVARSHFWLDRFSLAH